MNSPNKPPQSLAEMIATAEASFMQAVSELESQHQRLYVDRAQVKGTIRRLWSIPLKREQLAAMILNGVDEYGGAFFARMRWRTLMMGFVKPNGKRPSIPAGAELHDGRSIDRTEPLSLADQLAVQRSPSSLKTLQAALFGTRDDSADVLSVGGLTRYAPQAQPSPAFLVPDQKGEPRPLTQEDLAQALCYFCGDQVKAELMAAFDAAVPADFPAKPEDVADDEWNASLQDRFKAIQEAAQIEADHLAQLRDLDQQIMNLATPGSDAHKRAHGRVLTADDAY